MAKELDQPLSTEPSETTTEVPKIQYPRPDDRRSWNEFLIATRNLVNEDSIPKALAAQAEAEYLITSKAVPRTREQLFVLELAQSGKLEAALVPHKGKMGHYAALIEAERARIFPENKNSGKIEMVEYTLGDKNRTVIQLGVMPANFLGRLETCPLDDNTIPELVDLFYQPGSFPNRKEELENAASAMGTLRKKLKPLGIFIVNSKPDTSSKSSGEHKIIYGNPPQIARK